MSWAIKQVKNHSFYTGTDLRWGLNAQTWDNGHTPQEILTHWLEKHTVLGGFGCGEYFYDEDGNEIGAVSTLEVVRMTNT